MKEYRGKKIGSILYNLLEVYASSKRIKIMYLAVGKKLSSAQRIYEGKGWKKVKNNDYSISCYSYDYLYEKTLSL